MAAHSIHAALQGSVVLERGEHLAAIGLPQRGDGGLLGRGVDVEVILHRLAEQSAVGAHLAAEFLLATLTVGYVDGGAQGALLVGGIVEGARLGIVTVEVGHIIVALGHLAF